ncbi:MAG: glycosyltransferase [Clostridia bacterium]|nr:glycosyltransferase [Clostridia bacterium]
MNKRHVFFIGTLCHGGAERVISILTKHMADNGMNVKIVLYYDAEPFYPIHPNVEIIHIEKETGTKGIFKNILWLRKYIKNNADVLISFLAPFNIFAIAATLGLGKKVIVADRNDPRFVPLNTIIRRARDFLYRFANGVVVQNTDNKKYFSGAVQKKSAVIFNPIDLGDKRGQALATEKKKRIVSVGRLIKQKNQVLLIEAFADIHRDFPEYVLTIYGEGDHRELLENRTNELGLTGFVELPGSKKGIFDLISDAELFVLSSNYEGMPNALIEAMCLGLPVVSTAVSGTSDLIEDGANGRVVEVGNKEQLADAMREVLADDSIRKEYAERAVLVNDKLCVDKIMEEWQKIIEQTW